MRALFVTSQRAVVRTGVGTYSQALVGALAQAGFDLTTVSPEDDVRLRDGPPLPLRLARIRRALRPLAAGSWDLVHFADARDGALATRLFSRETALVGSVHDAYPEEWASADFPRFAYRDRPLRDAGYAWLRFVDRAAYRRFDALLSSSRHVSDLVSKIPGVDDERVHHIPIAISLPATAEQERVPGRLVFVGEAFARKGLWTLLDALPLLTATRPDVHLHVLGGSDRSVADATRRVRSLGLSDRVRLEGRLPRESVLERLAGAQALVLPALTEAWGLVCAEAWAAGAAVVTTGSGGIGELVAEGGAALVPRLDPAALAATLDSLLSDPARREALRREGRQRLERLSTEAMARRTIAAYEEAIRSRRAANRPAIARRS